MTASETPVARDAASPATQPTKPEVPAWRLVLTLTVAGALAALALSVVNELTRPTIEANRAAVLREAVGEVLGGPRAVTSLRVTDAGLVPDETVQYMEERGVERVYLGFADEARTRPIGFALVGAKFGYGSDPIKLAFGYDALKEEVIGLKVLEHKETPGIGTKIETEESFSGLFWRPVKGREVPPRRAPLVGSRDFRPSDVHQIDMISGATISSNAVIGIVNDALDAETGAGRWLKAYMQRAEGGE